jgi:GDPmannose 4,6-dehydratase
MKTGKKKALITGITGQDGSYLAEFLLAKGYDVHGLVRRSSAYNRGRIEHLFPDIHGKKNKIRLHYGDLSDSTSLHNIIRSIKPHEVYHLGAQSHVAVSFQTPEYTGDVTGLGTMRLLDAIRQENPSTRFYQASSSELFGAAKEVPQKETTPFHPRSPYGIAKLYSYWAAVNYREAYGMHASNGILFNHESPRRGENFVSKKITSAFAKIKAGKEDKVHLGNLDAIRDWGYAGDYIKAMWLIMQQDEPDDYVIATGESHTVREFVEEVAHLLKIDLKWRGKGAKEKGIDKKTGKVLVQVDPMYFRPADVDFLRGDASKARKKLGWKPKVNFKQLVFMMLDHDLKEQGLKGLKQA